jgi:hypothetical protein
MLGRIFFAVDGIALTRSAGVCQVRQNDSSDDKLARGDMAIHTKDAGP